MIAHRVRVSHCPRLARARLSVGQHGGVKAVQTALNQRQGGSPVHFFLSGVHPKHVVEPKGAIVPGDDLTVAPAGITRWTNMAVHD